MISASELRIGNYYIGFSGKEYQWTLEDFSILYSNQVDADELVKGFVPLTEEWLLKLGFAKVSDKIMNDKIVYGLPNSFQLNNVVNHKWDTYTNWNGNKNYITANGAALQFVHQLQNLYHALT